MSVEQVQSSLPTQEPPAPSQSQDGRTVEVFEIDPKYLNRPFERSMLQPHLDALRSEWGKVNRENANGLDKITQAIVDVEEGRELPHDEAEELAPDAREAAISERSRLLDETISAADATFRELLSAKEFARIRQDQLNSIKEHLEDQPVASEVKDAYLQKVDSIQKKWTSKSAKSRFATNKDYENFRFQLWEVNHDEDMPPLATLGLFDNDRSEHHSGSPAPADEEEQEDDEDEEEILVGSVAQSFNCPLTLRPMLEPMRSVVCNHVFSMEGLVDYYNHSSANSRTETGRLPCPGTGCSKMNLLREFQLDQTFQRRVKAWVRRQEEKANDPRNKDKQLVIDDEDDEDDAEEQAIMDKIFKVKAENLQ